MRISDWSSDVCSSYLGKPGTTNDETDACFNGFQATQVAIAWVGFDQPAPLGAGEVGARAALPIWIDYMRVALAGVPQARLPRPAGLVDVRVDPRTGKLASAGTPGAVFEIVQQVARASCRERVFQYVLDSVVALTLKNKNHN